MKRTCHTRISDPTQFSNGTDFTLPGSTRVMLNAQGDILERNAYYPFGLVVLFVIICYNVRILVLAYLNSLKVVTDSCLLRTDFILFYLILIYYYLILGNLIIM